MWLTHVFVIVFSQQWRSLVQKIKLYQALAAQALVGEIKSLLVLGFADNDINT